jgi:hypothetical protein
LVMVSGIQPPQQHQAAQLQACSHSSCASAAECESPYRQLEHQTPFGRPTMT